MCEREKETRERSAQTSTIKDFLAGLFYLLPVRTNNSKVALLIGSLWKMSMFLTYGSCPKLSTYLHGRFSFLLVNSAFGFKCTNHMQHSIQA